MQSFELSENEFNRFRNLVYEKCGINLSSCKKELVRARLSKRLRNMGLNDFKSYLQLVKADDTGEELIQMINQISTNLTHFFREQKHFDFLKEEILSAYKVNGRSIPIRIWSAGCSSGEEPYSLAIWILENMDSCAKIDLKILATDISTKTLETAKNGIYPESKIKMIPQNILRKYFQKGQGKWDGYYRVKPTLRNMIAFGRLNLMDSFSFYERFCMIFCRNVMIYFDKQIQENLVNKYYHCLKENGYLFVGHSESLMNLNHSYDYVKPAIYRKSSIKGKTKLKK